MRLPINPLIFSGGGDGRVPGYANSHGDHRQVRVRVLRIKPFFNSG